MARRPMELHAICWAVASVHAADRDDRRHSARVHDGPLQGLHAAHGSAHDSEPPGDAEVVGEHALGAHHVADRHDREAGTVRAAVGGVGRGRTSTALAAAEDVGAHHEVPVRVDRQAGADHAFPPPRAGVAAPARAEEVAVAGPRVADEHGVGRIGGEGAPRLVGEGDVVEAPAALEHQGPIGGEREELPPPGRVAGEPGAGDRRRRRHAVVPPSPSSVGCPPGEAFVAGASNRPHPRPRREAPWGFLPGCRTRRPCRHDRRATPDARRATVVGRRATTHTSSLSRLCQELSRNSRQSMPQAGNGRCARRRRARRSVPRRAP